ncbi:hypothetical protein SGRI78S_06750 [Streptomyces griseus subsp. griseus]
MAGDVPYGWSGAGPEADGASRSVSAQKSVVRRRGPTTVGAESLGPPRGGAEGRGPTTAGAPIGGSGAPVLARSAGPGPVRRTSAAPPGGDEAIGSAEVRVDSRIDIEVSSQMMW